ncbi:MAG TPA: MbcA/ParS/Xre antitoxin family protein [Methylomirabilota bacterium]|nr:MbcA/ParS/Xre antitoxin family protein [Methylomirabilota bacterium]
MTSALLKERKNKDLSSLIDELLAARERINLLLRNAESVLRASGGRIRKKRLSALDEIQQVIIATEDLRTSQGNLSADRVAKFYGISVSQLADWAGRSRQTVAKTPDADSLQELLTFFERVARLKMLISPESFRKWVRTPNKSLDGKRPLELLATNERGVVADLVEDMLTTSPG